MRASNPSGNTPETLAAPHHRKEHRKYLQSVVEALRTATVVLVEALRQRIWRRGTLVTEHLCERPPELFRDPDEPLPARIDDLLGRLTVAEKLALLHQYQAAVPRLGIGSFRTGTEALHGLAWLGPATVFPQALGLASTWNTGLVERIGAAVGAEVRGFHHKDPERAGLNVWAPVVNPYRARRGRGPGAVREIRRSVSTWCSCSTGGRQRH
jgi:hypothetical protein